ncbi:hypothetical protein CGCSCA4_v008060 [Colletotrichum siamense]|uniref:Nephrocystin 3-like N-terminal domain-containing protein n=1 Tax=Colletotrichum siamense TaxID=690259 RepID=A0A9P5K592_COLSI|nr:hypothetical protein CGCSCA4_v008060 [Colletotrichum siamense]KAF4859174.1 hypothetical protein CGCSCA2_v006564 [Colletotrichum siamense]
MSGLEAFSMVCNVMTVISFGLETAKLCRSIHESGSSDPELAKHARRMRESSEQLLQLQLSATTDAEKRLQDVVSECLQCTKDIEKEVIYLSPKKPGILRAMKSTIKTIRRRPHLDQLKARLETSRNTMNTFVIGEILEKCVESGKLNAGNFEALIRDQQAFQMAHKQRSQVVKDLMTQFHDRSKEIVITACKKIEDKIDVVQLRQDADKAYERLLGSLDYEKMNTRRSAIQKKHDMTFEWIFEGLELDDTSISDTDADGTSTQDVTSFVREADVSAKHEFGARRALERQRRADLIGWLRGDSRDLYWISGKPGSGKSTLMKFITYDKRTKTALRSWRSQPEIISHFLWKPGIDLQNNLRGMLCSLLHQTLVMDEDIGARLLHDRPSLRHRKKIDDWDSDDLKNTLFEAFQATSRSYLVILDGLDELSRPHRGMSQLFELLDELIAEDGVKLCVSSRPERVFEERFSSGRLLRMQDLTFQDILNYTLATLNETTLEADDHLKELIVNEIMKKSEGVFIWVHTVLENVKHGISEFSETWHDVYDRITELPSDLMELYRDMWSRLGDSKKYV